MNLHAIIKNSINAINPDVTFTLYCAKSGGSEINGWQSPMYSAPVELSGQFQNVDNATIEQRDGLTINTDTARLYFDTAEARTLDRQTARAGDMVLIGERWYLITAVQDDFRGAGWICAHLTLQTRGVADSEVEADE